MKFRVAVACSLFFSVIVSAAEPAYVGKFKAVQTQVRKVQEIFQSGKAVEKREELKTLSEAGLDLLPETIDAIKEGLEKALSAIHGASLAKEAPPDPLFPFKVDHNTHSLLRAHLLQGNFRLGMEVLELIVANVRLVSDWLTFSQAAAIGAGRERLPYGDYTLIRTQLTGALETARKLMPVLPGFPVSEEKAEGKREISPARLEAFYGFFSSDPDRVNLPEALRRNLLSAINVIDQTAVSVENYHNFYPQKNNEGALQALTTALSAMPGFHECINLSRGLGDFEGEPCRPKEFEDGLKRYIAFYDRHSASGSALLSSLLEFFAAFKDDEGVDAVKAKWDSLRDDISAHVRQSKFHARVKERWPGVSRVIFADHAALAKLLADGPEFHAFLKKSLDEAGLSPKIGFDGDYFENVEGARALLQRFGAQKLEAAPASFSRIGITTACKPFLDGTTDDSPWTINTLVAADSPPRTVPSTAGAQRIIWANEVKAGNAVAIQNSQLADKMLAGLSVRTAMALVVPNVVQTRLLLGKETGEDLEAYGIKKGTNDSLGFVGSHYRFPEWKAVISASQDAYWDLVRQHAAATEVKTPWSEEATRTAASADFRAKFRKEMGEAGTQLQEIGRTLEKVKTEAHKLTSPAITTVLEIPIAFTGEEDRRVADGINHSLIHTFLPSIMQDFIRRKYPQTRTDRAEYTKRYNELKHTFTIDQFMEQLDWYWGMDLVRQAREGSPELFADLYRNKTRAETLPPRPLRRPDFIGVEEMKLLWTYPVVAARLLNHTMDSYQRKLDYLEYAQTRLYYRYPALKLGDSWKSYDDSRFDLVMEAFLQNAVDEANRILELKNTKAVLDYFVPNLPLMNMVLRYHPDQKLTLCKEQKERKLWDDRIDTVLNATSAVATTAAYVPVLAPVGIAVEGVVLVIKYMRAYQKYQEMAQAEKWAFAAASQLDETTTEENGYYLREMEGAYGQALAEFAVHAALVAPAVVIKLPALKSLPRLMVRTPKAFMRAVKSVRSEYRAARALEEAASKVAINAENASLWFTKSQGRLARALDLLNRTRHKLMYPFTKLGVAQRWTHRSFFERFYKNFSFRRAHRFVGNIPGAGMDLFLNFPWSVMGYSWGRGVIAQGIQFYSLSEMSLFILHAVQGVNEASTELVMERVHQDPDSYKDLVAGMYDGQYRHADLVAMVEIDDKLGAKFRESAHDLVKQYYATLEAEERRNVISNFETMRAEIARQITEEEKKTGGGDPNKLRILKRTQRHAQRTLTSLRFFAKPS